MAEDSDRDPQEMPRRRFEDLPAPAQRALLEAEERRKAQEAAKVAVQDAEPTAKEVGGRNGPEPTRFGDWEKKGITYDF